MRTTMILAAVLAGCSAEQGFGESKPPTVEAGGEGRVTVYPSDGVVIGPFEAGLTKVGGFRLESVGDFPLQVISVTLIDAGENGGTSVFSDLQPAISTNVVPFDIAPEEGAEFKLTATMMEAGTATGQVEIYTNDSTVNDGGPGYVRVALTATATSNAEAPDDTGSAESSSTDTGDTDDEDTGPTSDEGTNGAAIAK